MWLTVAQLAQIQNKTERAVRKAIASGKYATARHAPKTSQRGGTSGQAWEISAYDPAVPETVRRQLGIEERAVKLKKMKEAEQLTIKPQDIQNDGAKRRLRVVSLAQSKPEGMGAADW